MCAYAYGYISAHGGKSLRSPVGQVSGVCAPPNMGTGNWTWVLFKNSMPLSYSQSHLISSLIYLLNQATKVKLMATVFIYLFVHFLMEIQCQAAIDVYVCNDWDTAKPCQLVCSQMCRGWVSPIYEPALTTCWFCKVVCICKHIVLI